LPKGKTKNFNLKNQIFFAKSKVCAIKVADEKIHQTTRHMRFKKFAQLDSIRSANFFHPNCADEMVGLVI
jgi:hypothetical protein